MWPKEVTKVGLFLTSATILSRTQSNGKIASLSYRLSGVMAEIDLQIFSLNCNGLNDDVKRNAVFSKLKRSAAGTYLLQETHSTLKIEQQWQHEWGNKAMYFSHGASNSRGVAIISQITMTQIVLTFEETQKVGSWLWIWKNAGLYIQLVTCMP